MSQVHDHGSVVDSDVKLLDFFKTSSPEILDESKPMVNKKDEAIITYYCEICDKKFTDLQAFGGHQNSHKHKRVTAEGKNAATADVFDGSESVRYFYYPPPPPYYYHPAMAPTLSLGNKALGVKPTIHKPTHWQAAHGYPLWSRQQPMTAAMVQQSRYAASTSTGSRDGFLHQMEVIDNGGNSTNNINTTLELEAMGNSNKSSNASQNLDVECNNHGLDLTLKL